MTAPKVRISRWAARLAGAVTAWLTLLLVRVQTAAAVTIAEDTIGQTPPALGFIQLKDSRGISIWNYELSLDRGGLTSADKFVWSMITDTCWGAYRAWCALGLWFLDWVLSFSWINTLARPLLAVGDAMQGVISRLGLVPTFLTLTALVAMLWMLKGKMTAAIWDVGIACVIAALASGVFAQPVQMIAGPDGYIVKAHQVGQELAAELATGDSEGKSPQQLRAAQTGQLVDTFIRQPTQMINFGRVLDGGKCEGAYTEVVKAGPYGNDSDIRDRVGECDESLGEYAGNPASSMAMGSLVFIPAAFVILFMAMVLAGSVIAAAVWAMFQSVKAIVTMVTGLLPGGGRGSLMLTVAETLVALLIIVFTSVFLSVFLLVIQAMFAGSSEESVSQTFVIVDILIVVGLFVYWRQRKQIKTASQRLAQWMSQRPGGAPATRLPDRQAGLSLGRAATAVRTVTGLAQLRAQRAAANRAPSGPTLIDNRQQAAVFFGGMPRPGGPATAGEFVREPGPGRPGRPQLPGGPDYPRLPGGPDNPQLPPGGGGGGGPRRLGQRKLAGALVRAGTSAALAYATGGASTVIGGASKASGAMRSVRRARLGARLAAASSRNAVGTNRQPQVPAAGPTGPMPMRTKPTPGRPARATSPNAEQGVIQGEVITSRLASATPRRSTAATSAHPSATPGKAPAPAPGKRTSPAGKETAAPIASRAQTVDGQSRDAERAARLRARLTDRARGKRRSA